MMKRISSLALALIVLLLFAISASAQNKDKTRNKDYVVTTNGDTVVCRVKHSLLGSSTKYRTADTGAWKTITIDSIKAYSMSATTVLYRRVTPANDSLSRSAFMQVVEDGKICLYELDIVRYNGRTTYTSILWYATKGSVINELKTSDLINDFKRSKKERKLDFANMLMDNKAVYDLFLKDDQFSFDQLRNIVHLYNTGKPFVDPNEVKEDRSAEFNPNQN